MGDERKEMAIYGYARISTPEQSLARQIDNIKRADPKAVVVSEAYTGKSLDRPEWNKLYKNLRSGDTVIFDEFSRMSRSAEEGYALYNEFFNKGINLIFISEPHINTDVYRKAGEKQIEINLESGSEPIDKFGNGMVTLVNELLLDLAKEQIRLAFEKSQSEVDYNSRRTSNALKKKQERNEELKILYPDNYQDQPDFRQIGQPKGAKLTTKKSIEAKKIIKKHSKDFNGTLTDPEVIKLIGCARGSYYKWKRQLRSELLS